MRLFRDAYRLRDLGGRALRRARKLVGRADPTPWVIRPRWLRRGDAYVDFVVGLDFINNNSALTKMFAQALAPYGLSLLVANSTNCHKLTAQVRRGWLRPHVLLDLCSAVHAEFGDLLREAAAAGVYTIGEPAKLDAWTWKAKAQPRLEAAGMPVPPTVLIPTGEPSRELTADERHLVGERCVIKPSWGVAGQGVVANVRPTREAIDAARRFNPHDDYLVQRMVRWEQFGNRPAYVRGYNILGCRTLLWWSPDDHHYDFCSWQDVRKYDLMGALDLVDRMARLTGMDYFSSEIAITNGVGQPRFVLIDYCNDQCDLNPGTAEAKGPPAAWSRWVCERFAEFVWKKKSGGALADPGSIWLASDDATTDGAGPRMVSSAA